MKPHMIVVNTALVNPEGQVMLFERVGTETSRGMFVFPGGRLDPGENVYDVAVRETKEEIGVDIEETDLEFAGIFERPGLNDADFRTIQFFFVARRWMGIPKSMEPDKHGEPGWFDRDKLPPNTHPLDRAVIEKNFAPELTVIR